MSPNPKSRRQDRLRRVLLAVAITGSGGCDRDKPAVETAASASAAPQGLSSELATKVLAKVGDRTITLGDYAEALERMDRFERLRYQTEDRKKQLLDEMIRVELLAIEARRRGIDKTPEAQMMVSQVLREELLRSIREQLPALEDVPSAEVRAYYESHRNDFREPERRRISHIEMADGTRASAVLAEAKKATPSKWGELVRQHSLDKPAKDEPELPLELAGDLGMVTPPTHGASDNPKVPEPVRAAAFQIPEPGQVLDRLVQDGSRVHIVRLMGVNPARDRAFDEAERTIRVKLLQQKIRESEEKLEKTLREKYPVKIHEAALSTIQVPSTGDKQ